MKILEIFTLRGACFLYLDQLLSYRIKKLRNTCFRVDLTFRPLVNISQNDLILKARMAGMGFRVHMKFRV